LVNNPQKTAARADLRTYGHWSTVCTQFDIVLNVEPLGISVGTLPALSEPSII